jgi:hypothetical protein
VRGDVACRILDVDLETDLLRRAVGILDAMPVNACDRVDEPVRGGLASRGCQIGEFSRGRARTLRTRRFSRAPALLLKAAMSEAKREPEGGRRAPRTRRGRA